MWALDAGMDGEPTNLTADFNDKTVHFLPTSPDAVSDSLIPNDSQDKTVHGSCRYEKNTRPYYVQLNSRLDFSRLVCALERLPFMCMIHKYDDGRDILCAQADMLQDRPIIYYVLLDKGANTASFHYVYYGFRQGKEEYGMTDAASDASMVYSPIVRIKSLPHVLHPDNNITDKYHSIALEDISSLTKMTWGRGDVLFPLFLFFHDKKWILGATLAQTSHSNAPSYFTYVELDSDPQKPYLMFSAQKATAPTFVDSPSKHGYSYMKIIRLMNRHPLIDYDDL